MTEGGSSKRILPAWPQGLAFNPALFGRFMASFGHTGWLGVSYHAHGDDWVELALPWRADLAGDAASGVLASGPIISMMDMACSMAIWARKRELTHQVTIDLRVDYTRAAAPQRTVYGRGECYKLTRSVGFVRGIAHDGDPDDPVAHVTGSFMLMDEAAT